MDQLARRLYIRFTLIMLLGAAIGYFVGYSNGKLDGVIESGGDPAIVLGGR